MKGMKIIAGILIILFTSGCTIVFKKTPPEEVRKAKQLKQQVEDLSAELAELSQAKKMLEEKLAREIKDKQVKLELAERGLVITFVSEVLFDSGKAKIRPEAHLALDKVAEVLQRELVQREIGIEGHTDNEPIKYSGWESNWELSSARSLSVLHYLVDKKGLDPRRVSARGYGEYRPLDSNETKESRQKNRRVEIIILPKTAPKKTEISDKEKIKEIEEKRIEEEINLK